LTNGAVFANLLPRLPEIKSCLELGNSAYGLAVAALPAGAILAGLGAGALVRRFTSARVAVAGMVLASLGVLAAGVAPSVWLLVAALVLAGAVDAITDVAQNAHGLRVQRRYGRSIINSFHALWSVGSTIGGIMAAAAITAGLPLGVHLGLSAVIFSTVAVVAGRFALPGPDRQQGSDRPVDPDRPVGPDPTAGPAADSRDTAAPAAPSAPASSPSSEFNQVDDAASPAPKKRRRLRWSVWAVLSALVVISVSGAVVEESGNSWAALYLSQSLAAPAQIAALGFIALVGAQFVGRLIGDRLIDRFGQRAVARSGGLIVAAGMGLALAFPSLVGTIVGFGAAGFGVATLVPAAMHQADELPGLRPGTGLTVVAWLMRIGFLATPPLVGLISDVASLRVGLLIMPAAGVAVVALASVLPKRRQR
jgi:MFS family permease